MQSLAHASYCCAKTTSPLGNTRVVSDIEDSLYASHQAVVFVDLVTIVVDNRRHKLCLAMLANDRIAQQGGTDLYSSATGWAGSGETNGRTRRHWAELL